MVWRLSSVNSLQYVALMSAISSVNLVIFILSRPFWIHLLNLGGNSTIVLLYQCRGSCRVPTSLVLVISFSPVYCSAYFRFLFQKIMDPSSLLNDWSRLSLTSEEEDVSVVADREVVERVGLSLDLCLLGKLYCHRPIGAEVMRRNFRSTWKIDSVLQVDRLGMNVFIFRFGNDIDRVLVFRQGSWLCERFLLVLVFPIHGLRPVDHPFSSVAFWVHIFELPIDWFNQSMAERLGNAIGIF